MTPFIRTGRALIASEYALADGDKAGCYNASADQAVVLGFHIGEIDIAVTIDQQAGIVNEDGRLCDVVIEFAVGDDNIQPIQAGAPKIVEVGGNAIYCDVARGDNR